MAKKQSRSSTSSPTNPGAPERRRTVSDTTRTTATSSVVPVAEPDGSPAIARATADDMASAGNDSPETRTPSYEEIAEAAYQRYLARGGEHGHDFDDWLEAERTLWASKG